MLSLIKKLLREGLFDRIPDEDFKRAYESKINSLYDNLLIKGAKSNNYNFILGNNIKYNPIGEKNRCEENVFLFIKNKINENILDFFPVSGYMFDGKNLFPVEHWWVFNKKDNSFIEITPLIGEKPRCYAGIINFDINKEIKEANKYFDIDFFKGGNAYTKYFKK